MRGTLLRRRRGWGPLTDHPRACGELPARAFFCVRSYGSSPRMRGTQCLGYRQPPRTRIIPRHAGNSSRWPARTARRGGSSPRMRGTLFFSISVGLECRIIHAHAGNSSCLIPRLILSSDHPRACGELDVLLRSSTDDIGSSPRMRELTLPTEESQTCGGSSPRMRGTRDHPSPAPSSTRIIPAHAGNLRTDSVIMAVVTGSSPRMRGTPVDSDVEIDSSRIIPAHAGNSLLAVDHGPAYPDHPRACGELNNAAITFTDHDGSSPRMRGTHRLLCVGTA